MRHWYAGIWLTWKMKIWKNQSEFYFCWLYTHLDSLNFKIKTTLSKGWHFQKSKVFTMQISILHEQKMKVTVTKNKQMHQLLCTKAYFEVCMKVICSNLFVEEIVSYGKSMPPKNTFSNKMYKLINPIPAGQCLNWH